MSAASDLRSPAPGVSAGVVTSAHETASLKRMSDGLRLLSVDAVERAASGHPGLPLGMADVVAVLYRYFLVGSPSDSEWPSRDRLVLSAGHGSALLYSALHFAGYPGMSLDDLRNFRQKDSPAAGHPEFGHAPGIETTTGPLGQGLANAVGFAIGERLLQARFGSALVDHFTYAIAGDGCLMEGISQEAISLAGHLQLNKLIVLFDDNGITIDGKVSLACSEDTLKRFESAGWRTQAVDGHDSAAVYAAVQAARGADKPSLIACKTVIGKGAGAKAGTEKCHGSPLGAEGIANVRASLGRVNAPFEFETEDYAPWRAYAERGEAARNAWQERLAALPADKRAAFEEFVSGAPRADAYKALEAHKKKLIESGKPVSTRKASQLAIEAARPHVPQLIGGSADLSGSNCTLGGGMRPVTAEDASGDYIYYGIREHAMGAVMNGLSLYNGFIPYGGTFLVFADYCRPAIRLAALMRRRVVYVMTHDSIGLGEDGPTHQPVEHLASLRAIPHLHVFRPADAAETAECWALALQRADGPSLLALSRQDLPMLRTASHPEGNLSARGAYAVSDCEGAPQAVLLATGSEVSLATEAAEMLRAKGVKTRVVSVPSLELLSKQDAAYVETLIPSGAVHAVIEAGRAMGWRHLVRKDTLFFTVEDFGFSAPYKQIYEAFGLTKEAIASNVAERVAASR